MVEKEGRAAKEESVRGEEWVRRREVDELEGRGDKAIGIRFK